MCVLALILAGITVCMHKVAPGFDSTKQLLKILQVCYKYLQSVQYWAIIGNFEKTNKHDRIHDQISCVYTLFYFQLGKIWTNIYDFSFHDKHQGLVIKWAEHSVSHFQNLSCLPHTAPTWSTVALCFASKFVDTHTQGHTQKNRKKSKGKVRKTVFTT